MALKTGGKKNTTSEATRLEIARAQIRRLERFTDCVYAVALILVIQWLPLPEESALAEGRVWLLDLFAEFAGNLVGVLIGVVFIILYWLRSTDQLARLERSDGVHASASIASVFFLLLLLYVVRVGGEVTGASARAGESVAVTLVGLAGAVGWWHARRRGLLRPGVSQVEAAGVQVEALTEPLTALATLPVAYLSELWWNLAWLLYIPIAALLRRRVPDEEAPD